MFYLVDKVLDLVSKTQSDSKTQGSKVPWVLTDCIGRNTSLQVNKNSSNAINVPIKSMCIV